MKLQARVILLTIGILLVTLGFNSLLSLASFEKLYVSSLISTYELAGKNLKRKVEQSLRFGKPIEQFKGMERLLEEVIRNYPEISLVAVVEPDGKIIYHSDPSQVGTALPRPAEGGQGGTHLEGDHYVTFIPLMDRSEKVVAHVYLELPRRVITQRVTTLALENLGLLAVLLPAASLGLAFSMTVLVTRPLRRGLARSSRILRGREAAVDAFSHGTDPVASHGADTQSEAAAVLSADEKARAALTMEWKGQGLESIRNEVDRLEATARLFSIRMEALTEEAASTETSLAALRDAEARVTRCAAAVTESLEQYGSMPLTMSVQPKSLPELLDETHEAVRDLRALLAGAEAPGNAAAPEWRTHGAEGGEAS